MPALRAANNEELAQANDLVTAPICTLVRAVDHRCERRDVRLRLIRQRSTCSQMTFVTPRPGIIGSEKARHAVTIMELANVSGTGLNIVVRIVRIGAETISSAQFCPGPWHDLHQPHGCLGRPRLWFASAFDVHQRAYPMFWHDKALGRLADKSCEGIDRQAARSMCGRQRPLGMRRTARQQR